MLDCERTALLEVRLSLSMARGCAYGNSPYTSNSLAVPT